MAGLVTYHDSECIHGGRAHDGSCRPPAILGRRADPDMADLLSRPEWTIVGGRIVGGRYRIIASKELTSAGLTYDATVERIPGDDLLNPFATVVTSRTITMSCVIRHFVIIEAGSYGACLEALFANWAPDGPAAAEQLAIGSSG